MCVCVCVCVYVCVCLFFFSPFSRPFKINSQPSSEKRNHLTIRKPECATAMRNQLLGYCAAIILFGDHHAGSPMGFWGMLSLNSLQGHVFQGNKGTTALHEGNYDNFGEQGT